MWKPNYVKDINKKNLDDLNEHVKLNHCSFQTPQNGFSAMIYSPAER